MKAKLLATFFMLLSSGIAYAIDPSGARVDWDDYGDGGGIGGDFAIVLVAIAVIGILIFIAYLYFSDKFKNKPKPQEKIIEMYSPEWWAIQKEQAKEEKRETKGCIIGSIIGVGFFFVIPIFSTYTFSEAITISVCFIVPALLLYLAFRYIIGNKFIPNKFQGFTLFVAFVLIAMLWAFLISHFCP